jgi:uncharacterized protein (DUF2147 family)
MIRSLIRTASIAAVLLSTTTAFAQMTPVGLWRQIDDETGKVQSEIRIVETNGVISGTIESLIDPKDPTSVCDKCSDDRKDKPIKGLEIIRGLTKAEGKDLWEGGTVLQPSTGKIFKATITPIEGGKKLQLRGYIAFFYKTQTWVRVQ